VLIDGTPGTATTFIYSLDVLSHTLVVDLWCVPSCSGLRSFNYLVPSPTIGPCWVDELGCRRGCSRPLEEGRWEGEMGWLARFDPERVQDFENPFLFPGFHSNSKSNQNWTNYSNIKLKNSTIKIKSRRHENVKTIISNLS
jgi:hypothetical protein